MNRIFKYTIYDFDSHRIQTMKVEMPAGAKILSVGTEGKKICTWARIDSEETSTQIKEFGVYGTGHPVPTRGTMFLGTVFMDAEENGQSRRFVWHVFEHTLGR